MTISVCTKHYTCTIIYFSGIVCYGQDTFYFSQKPQDKSVVEGTETILLCDVNSRRHIVFDWIQSGKPVTNTSRRFQEGSYLRILRVTREDDTGPFQCIATNVTSGFSLQSGEASLNIQCKYHDCSHCILYVCGNIYN